MYTYTVNRVKRLSLMPRARSERRGARMRRRAVSLVIACAIAPLAACAPTDSPTAYEGYELDWADEFEGAEIDPSIWRFAVGGGGYGNNELQFYTNDARNARVERGILVIEARREKKAGWPYTSAKLETRERKSMLYGRLDVRAKLPGGRGSWPAVWMLPEDPKAYGLAWPDSGEIDIMEHVGYEPGIVHFTVHTGAYNHRLGTQRGRSKSIPTAIDEFHVYGIEWTPEFIRWFVDGKRVFEYRNEGAGWEAWPFDAPYYLILNIACGGDWGGARGIDNESLPWRMEVDWVRAYRRAE